MTFKLSRLRAYAALWLVFALTVATLAGITHAGAVPSGTSGTDPRTPSSYARARALALVKPPRPKAVAVDYGSGLWSGLAGSEYRSGTPATSSVTLVGDSIAVRCTPAIRAALAAQGQTLAVIAWAGARTADVQTITQGQILSPKVVVVAGTNDVFDPPAAATSVPALASWLSQTGTRFWWVSTYVGRTATLADDARNSGQVNERIAATVGEARLIDWTATLTAARGRGRTIGYYVQDGVHPWAAAGTSGGVAHGDGCAAYAVGVAAAVKGV